MNYNFLNSSERLILQKKKKNQLHNINTIKHTYSFVWLFKEFEILQITFSSNNAFSFSMSIYAFSPSGLSVCWEFNCSHGICDHISCSFSKWLKISQSSFKESSLFMKEFEIACRLWRAWIWTHTCTYYHTNRMIRAHTYMPLPHVK